MPVYQVPQFLDSGDKILGPLNVRQFGYAMGGFFIGFIMYMTISKIAPGIGLLALVPSVPVAGLTAFLAFGKYNGRDTEVYVFKFITYFKKPKVLRYKRLPDTYELDKRKSKLTFESISKEWTDRVAKISSARNTFESQDVSEKIAKIKQLGSTLDTTSTNRFQEIAKRESLNLAKDRIISQAKGKQQNQPPIQIESEMPRYRLPGSSNRDNNIKTKRMQLQEEKTYTFSQ